METLVALSLGKGRATRSSPVTGVLLTNADLDHVLGLISLRGETGVRIFSTSAVRHTLTEAMQIEPLLRSFGDVEWKEIAGARVKLSGGQIEAWAILLGGDPPPYARSGPADDPGHSAAYELRDLTTGGRLVIAPDVARITPELLAALQKADAILFDGTFWSDDELRQVKPGARTSREMGHLPIRDGSLEVLKSLPARKKSFIHINNTNPVLDPASPERDAIEEAGMSVAEDGTEWTL
jgi:pyrroloquinoline quinone biosynthesis protein B